MNVCEMNNVCGGVGSARFEQLLGAAEMADKCGLYARITLHPGSSVGYHEHHGDGECYFILSGECVYDDNGVKRTVKAGDVTWTPDGKGHSLDNTAGKADVVFMALIIKK